VNWNRTLNRPDQLHDTFSFHFYIGVGCNQWNCASKWLMTDAFNQRNALSISLYKQTSAFTSKDALKTIERLCTFCWIIDLYLWYESHKVWDMKEWLFAGKTSRNSIWIELTMVNFRPNDDGASNTRQKVWIFNEMNVYWLQKTPSTVSKPSKKMDCIFIDSKRSSYIPHLPIKWTECWLTPENSFSNTR